jgi:hypothetical protein
MAEPLGYTPPCLCCRTSDYEGPHFDRRWKVTLKADKDGSTELFQPYMTAPCAMGSQQLLDGDHAAYGHGQKGAPVLWVHPDCLKDYHER